MKINIGKSVVGCNNRINIVETVSENLEMNDVAAAYEFPDAETIEPNQAASKHEMSSG
jgi:hypothetical protein